MKETTHKQSENDKLHPVFQFIWRTLSGRTGKERMPKSETSKKQSASKLK